MKGDKKMEKEIWFDMDGTIADLYGVSNWLDDLINERVRPYKEAKALVNLSQLARILNRLQTQGYTINIVSWTSKNGTKDYNKKVMRTKVKWLQSHMPSVCFDRIEIIEYGTHKEEVTNHSKGILFDDEENNRKYWSGTAYDEKNIINILKGLK